MSTKRFALLGTLIAGLAVAGFVTMANDEATWVVQSFINGNRVIHTKGLSGAGQLITMGDGAPWMGHPAFADPNRPFVCSNPNGSVGPMHRKVHAWLSICPTGTCQSPHGTHDAGELAGDAPPYGTWNGNDGHAYGARLIVADVGVGQCQPPDVITQMYLPSHGMGSRIATEGFGAEAGTAYSSGARKNDEFAWDHKDYLIVTPAGNGGGRTCSIGGTSCVSTADCDPNATCLGDIKIRPQSQAKNVITVGASNNSHETCVPAVGECEGGEPCSDNEDCGVLGGNCQIFEPAHCQITASPCGTDDDCPLVAPDSVSDFSARGPAADGRIKPTLVAPGENICSTTTSTLGDSCAGLANYRLQSGTSFSHPVVSGSAALVRQYFTGGWYPSGIPGGSPALLPSAALLKAVMINGAAEMTDTASYSSPTNRQYPNMVQGWGRLHLDNSLYFSGDTRKLAVCQDKAGLASAGEQRWVSLNVAGSSQPIEVTLVWTDPPRVPYDANAIQLVNDLDLVLADPSAAQYKGNVFAGFAPGQSAVGGSADRLNVEENVLRYNPALGSWVATVSAYSTPSQPQPFALAITGNVSLVPGAYVTAAADHATNPGTIFANDYSETHVSDNVNEVLKETSGGLTHTWRFDLVPCTSTRHVLHVEGNRPANSDGDDFQFYYSTDGVTFTLIPGARINKPFEPVGGLDYPFDDAGLMGTVYIQVRDTAAGGGSTLDKVNIDHLEIR